MKAFQVFIAAMTLAISAQASACILCDYPVTTISEDSTLSYGTVVSLEPVDMSQVDYTQLNDHTMAQAGAALSGGSFTGAVIGSVVAIVADAVVHKSTKVIDGYMLGIELDTGEQLKVVRTKNQAKSAGYDKVGARLSIVASPKMTYYKGSNVTKEESPEWIARRAPHQVKKPVDSAPEVKPAEQKADVQPAITNAEDAKTASAN